MRITLEKAALSRGKAILLLYHRSLSHTESNTYKHSYTLSIYNIREGKK